VNKLLTHFDDLRLIVEAQLAMKSSRRASSEGLTQ